MKIVTQDATDVPIIDVGPLFANAPSADATAVATVAKQLDAACRDTGFFSIVGHGVSSALGESLDRAARDFFALPETEKASIAMAVGGRAWRGWFPLGGEVTSGVPDRKEGLYFGEELRDDDPRVVAGIPLHGRNLFPSQVPELRGAVLSWLEELTRVAHGVTR